MKLFSGNKGMTLLEVMMVVSIVGILAAIAVPTYLTWLPGIRVNSAAEKIAGDLQEARLKAVSENVLFVVYFDEANNTYNIYRDSDAHFLSSSTPNPAELYKSVNIPKEYAGVVLGQNVDVVPPGAPDRNDIPISPGIKTQFEDITGSTSVYEIFRPDGTAVSTGVVYLVPLEDMGQARYDRDRAVTVDASTGFAKTWTHPSPKTGYWK